VEQGLDALAATTKAYQIRMTANHDAWTVWDRDTETWSVFEVV